ncbi:hypothetical protein GCM10010232_70850 [Streptomyces amakusaensis]
MHLGNKGVNLPASQGKTGQTARLPPSPGAPPRALRKAPSRACHRVLCRVPRKALHLPPGRTLAMGSDLRGQGAVPRPGRADYFPTEGLGEAGPVPASDAAPGPTRPHPGPADNP